MKMNETIRYFRLKNNLTQEQVANRLGVTAPAVNKWEKGISCPDITILPALARLLGTDCNTLLCFEQELSKQQIASLLNELQVCFEQKGIKEGYDFMIKTLREYPSCEALAYYAAALLDATLQNSAESTLERSFYMKEVIRLYEFAAQSKESEIRDQALASLVIKKLQQHEIEAAQELLDQMTQSPNSFGTDKKQLQAKVFIEREEYSAAAKLLEEELVLKMNTVYSILLTLMQIALKEERLQDAKEIASIHDEAAQLLGMGHLLPYIGRFSLACERKDTAVGLDLLMKILRSCEEIADVNDRPLYRHLQAKETPSGFGEQMKKWLLHQLTCDSKMEFLKDTPEVQSLIAQEM